LLDFAFNGGKSKEDRKRKNKNFLKKITVSLKKEK